MSQDDPTNFLSGPPKVVNIGLNSFALELESQNVAVVHVDWVPPAGGNPELAALLSKLGS
jgi:FdrA protein